MPSREALRCGSTAQPGRLRKLLAKQASALRALKMPMSPGVETERLAAIAHPPKRLLEAFFCAKNWLLSKIVLELQKIRKKGRREDL